MGACGGYVTRLGGDEFGRAFLSLWEQEGVDRSGVIVEPEGTTAVYFIARREDGGHDFMYYRAHSPASRLQPEDLDSAYLAKAKVLHTSGISQAISDSARATPIERYHNAFLLRFDDDGRCRDFVEYYVKPG